MKLFRKSLGLCIGILAFASIPALANQTLSLSSDQAIAGFTDTDVTISGKAEVHLTSKTPLTNSTVNLVGNDAWLYLDYVKPSAVIACYLKDIKVDSTPADHKTNVRIAQYRGGCVIIPHGLDTYSKAITVYTNTNCEGKSKDLAVEAYHKDLEEFDNNIRSFVLRKGFQATLANNPDGTGHSRVYIADTEDLVINDLPEGFVTKDGSDKSFVSFIRVCKHQWVSKKGWCGWNQNVLTFTNATHSYAWSADYPGDDNTIDREFAPQRHHRGWPSFSQCQNVFNVSHLLGDNEPDNKNDPKEQPSEPIQIIREWKEFLKSGLRLGSPAPTGIWGGWLDGFFSLADSLNYRVDYVVYHQYEATTDFKSRINKAVTVSKGRPVWITEWNNGANWTNESWPDAKGPRRDANSNIMYFKKTTDNSGKEVEVRTTANDPEAYTKEVNRPLTEKNAAKQLEYMKAALANQDELDKLERLHFYNAVQDARAVEIDGELTPAGKYFAEYNQKLAYTKKSEFAHIWKIAPPLPQLEYSADYKTARLTWYDHNGETGKNYIVEKREDGGDWKACGTLELGKDYNAGETVVFEERINMKQKREYRVKATSYKGTASIYSRINTVTRDNAVSAPEVIATAEDQTTVRLTWGAIEGARGYMVVRRDADDAEFKTVIASTDKTTFSNTGLDKGHDYWYRVSVLSNADVTPVSEIVKVHTPVLTEAPEAVYDLFAAPGDGKVTLTWTKTWQSTWTVQRASDINGPYENLRAGVSSVKYEDKTVVNGTTYYYRLVPKRLSKEGEPSAPVKATPAAGNYFYVPFAEGKGLSAKDYYGGNNGTLAEASWTADRKGNEKGAVKLLSSAKGYVYFPVGLLQNLSDFTISLWFKRSGDNVGRIFDFGSGHDTQMLLDYGYNNKSGFRYKLRVGSKNSNMDATFNLEKERWYNIALSQEAGTLTIYVDGEALTSFKNQPNPSEMGRTTQNWLGRSQWYDNGDPSPDYCYDDLYIFNRAMSQEEIKKLMQTDDSSDVEEIFDSTPVKTIYYGIDGIRLENPAKGSIVIEQKIMSNGTVKTSKRIIR